MSPGIELGIRETYVADRAQLYRYKGNRCTSCGLSVLEMVTRFGTFDRMFELHHIDPDTKDPSYENLIRRKLSAEQIEEVDKCTLLCNQCHSIIHAQNVTAKLQLTVSLEGRDVSQTFDGWVVCDAQDKTFTFVTNERFRLQPCVVAFGCGKSLKLCAIEIEKPQHLVSWMHNVKELGGVNIFGRSAEDLLMRIEHVGPKKVKVTQKLGFPVTTMNMATGGNNKDNMWLRNGFVLKDNGEIHTSGTFSYECELL